MHAVFALTLLLVLQGCAYTLTGGSRPNPDVDLRPYIGKTLTLHGKFSLAGKVGPYVETPTAPVYLVPHGAFSWGAEYDRMQGKTVSVTGILHFQQFERGAANSLVQPPGDYYYFDADTAQVRLQ